MRIKQEKPIIEGRVLARVLAEELKHASGNADDAVVTAPNPRRDITQVSHGDVAVQG